MYNKEKRLVKSASNRMICGVCAGIGEYFNLDPTLIRLLWAILTFCGIGSGLLVYIIAAVVIPEE
ncbi:MAG: PspC domain-containing protein [Lachnospiraceae bacterium]